MQAAFTTNGLFLIQMLLQLGNLFCSFCVFQNLTGPFSLHVCLDEGLHLNDLARNGVGGGDLAISERPPSSQLKFGNPRAQSAASPSSKRMRTPSSTPNEYLPALIY